MTPSPTDCARVLEQLGFTVRSRSDREVIALRTGFRWDAMLINVVEGVWVHRVDRLDSERISADEARFREQWATLDPSAWPVGLQKARLQVILYLVEPDAVTEDGLARLRAPPAAGFGSCAAIAALVGDETVWPRWPMVGLLFWERIDHVLRSLAAPDRPPPPSASPLGTVMSVFMAVGLASLALALVFAVVMCLVMVLGVVVVAVVVAAAS